MTIRYASWIKFPVLILFFTCLCSQAMASDVNALVTCTNDIESRSLSIAPKEGGCELMYEKNDKVSVAASSANGTSHCEKARDKIRDRLKAAGWKCNSK